MFDAQTKVLSPEALPAWRTELASRGTRLVVTNGCFDLLHAGHVRYLEGARNEGDALLVGLNGDASVRELKGEGRPINSAVDRALVLGALGCVDAVCVFPEVRAERFLSVAQPDIYVKGGDYTLETLDQAERRIVEGHGGRIVLLSFVAGKSTTRTIARIAEQKASA